jgi:hypothetical protein
MCDFLVEIAISETSFKFWPPKFRLTSTTHRDSRDVSRILSRGGLEWGPNKPRKHYDPFLVFIKYSFKKGKKSPPFYTDFWHKPHTF